MGNNTVTNQSSTEDPLDIDVSNYSFINDKWIIKPTSLIIVETTIFLPVVIFGVFGNILSLYVLIKNLNVCTPTNMLIVNMATADLLSLLIHPWVFLTYDFFQNYELGQFGCKTEAGIECSILITSVINVSAISFDRLTAILLPRESRLTKKNTKIVMIASWILGFVISTPLFYSRHYKERQWKDFLEKYCTEETFITTIYWHVIITVIVWIPLSIQLICYISIYIKLRKYERIAVRKLNHQQVAYRKKAVRMMFTIIVTFLICRLPFTGLIFYRDQHLTSSSNVINMASGTYHNYWFLSKFFIFLNSALNPVIYSATNDKFQRGFKTTKLSKWLWFSSTSSKLKTSLPKQNLKTPETSTLFKKSIFFIFKKKHKLSTALTDVASDISVAKYDHMLNPKNN